MHLFYQPDISLNYLPEQESLHAVKVLRLQLGDEIIVLDGTGGYHRAKITLVHPKKCGFEILESTFHFGEKPYSLHVAIAPTKNIDRLEWFIEKAVEIGIDEITLLRCQFSERKNVNFERLQKIIIAAAKQSVRAYFPQLNPICNFEEFIRQNDLRSESQTRLIAHCYPEEKQILKSAIADQKHILILIGPEGDFSKEEVALAKEYGFTPVSLGSARLRTETAGVMVCATAAVVLGS
ncbi:MAG TPA: 16S rRNA (uracil(1498)-N(3))-methyltransferase [Paludibacter sp.]|jgi:16S rRNA (uracil1498-N3)-methyltransferase|nr:16S rRNA (uracil(1498)-N(3))-methyltransferase [Paludibacter sp.]